MPTAYRPRRRADSDPSIVIPRSLWPFSAVKTPETSPQLAHDPTAPVSPEEPAELKQELREWDAKETKRKASSLNYVHGSKLHQQDAPWPFAFNREFLELLRCASFCDRAFKNGIDHALVEGVKGNQMFFDFGFHNGQTPTRCLDLGTTYGDWVIDTAKHLPQCTFVGFDMVDIQIPLKYIEPSIASRVEWVHGNFCESPLPFKDEEFDYIHVESIAHGVRERDWDSLFQELHRIMKPGGRIELIQADARFPVLPSWFTTPIHTHCLRYAGEHEDTSALEFLLSDQNNVRSHAYMLLEELFFMVLERRWINPNPTSILPLYFNATFRHVISPPILHFPMPPLAPLPPFPQWALNPIATGKTTSDPLDATLYFVPVSEPLETSDSESVQTTVTGGSEKNDSAPIMPPFSSDVDVPRSPANSASFPQPPPTPVSPLLIQRASAILAEDDIVRSRSGSNSSVRSTVSAMSSTSGVSSASPTTRTPSHGARVRSSAILQTGSTTRLGGDDTAALFRMDVISCMGPEVLFMHLRHASQLVLAMREAMWDVLRECIVAKRHELVHFGFVESERELQDVEDRVPEFRRLFDGLMNRYKQDMHIRLSAWHSLSKMGFAYPRRQKMSQEQLAREEDLRSALLEAR
ncbi:uncharacterized protein PHACADRAFT_184637, partial [Phanerochaete carnosa HHB-10118-sp]